MAAPTALSIDVSANPALVASANATLARRPGADDELYARVAHVLYNRGYELHDPDQEIKQAVDQNLNENNGSWLAISIITHVFNTTISSIFAYVRGSNNILGRLPTDLRLMK